MVADRLHAVPETALGLGNVLDEREELDEADEGGYSDGDAGENDGVVENGDHVAGEGLGSVESHHEGAIGGVKEAHAGWDGKLESREWKGWAYR